MPETLLDKNKKWAAGRVAIDPDYFRRLSDLQTPRFLWIGCSDSRVPANVIAGLEPGEVFVHRNVANLVHHSDLNLLSVLEYAVEALAVEHIIVCGHYGCGGVQTAMEDCRHGIVDHWLQPIRDVADVNSPELASCDDEQARLSKLCELSIRSQVQNLSRTPIIQGAWRRRMPLSIHGWVYSLSDGLLHDLQCSLSAEAGNKTVA